MLAPSEAAIEQAGVDGRHLRGAIVPGDAEVLDAQEPKYRSGCEGCHETALMVEPFGVSLFRYAVADEGGARRAQRDQLVGIDWNVTGVPAAKGGLRGAVFEEVSGHPVVLARAGEVFDSLAKVPAMRLCAAFAGRTNQHEGVAGIEGH